MAKWLRLGEEADYLKTGELTVPGLAREDEPNNIIRGCRGERVIEIRIRRCDKALERQRASECKRVNTPSARNPKACYMRGKPEFRILCGSVQLSLGVWEVRMAKHLVDSGRHLLLENIGLAVLDCQIIERILKRCLTYALPQESPLPSNCDLSRNTLGGLGTVLRQHYSVSDDIDQLVSDFVEARNCLIHALFDLEGFSFDTAAGLCTGIRFAAGVRHTAKKLRDALAPIEKAWAEVAVGATDMRPWREYQSTTAESLAAAAGIRRRRSPSNKAVRQTRRTRKKG